MRMRSIGWLSAALLLPGCGGTSTSRLDEPPEGEVAPIKISYFRAYAEPRTQRLEPSFRAVMSHGWKDRLGESTREALMKAAPKKIFTGFLSDAEMRKYVRLLRDYGLDSLLARDTDSLNPQEFNRLALHPSETSFTRVFSVGTDKGSKSYYYKDQQRSADLIAKFVKCESFITRITEYSMKVEVLVPEKDRVIPRDR